MTTANAKYSWHRHGAYFCKVKQQNCENENSASGRVEALGPPDYNTSALNHSAALLPRCDSILRPLIFDPDNYEQEVILKNI